MCPFHPPHFIRFRKPAGWLRSFNGWKSFAQTNWHFVLVLFYLVWLNVRPRSRSFQPPRQLNVVAHKWCNLGWGCGGWEGQEKIISFSLQKALLCLRSKNLQCSDCISHHCTDCISHHCPATGPFWFASPTWAPEHETSNSGMRPLQRQAENASPAAQKPPNGGKNPSMKRSMAGNIPILIKKPITFVIVSNIEMESYTNPDWLETESL